MTDSRLRWRPSAHRPTEPGLRVSNALPGPDGGTASIYVFDAIDCWGGEWGVSASEFVAALNSVQAGRIDLHLNSPGGDYFEAVAMRAALLAHPATVDVYVDGLAASAASVLATVGERVVMATGSQIMIHKASSVSFGNADQMRTDAAMLEKVDTDIAAMYAARAGGTPEQWLTAMAAETWFSADEAVAAGLADEVAASPVRDAAPVAAAADRWILAAWKYPGREAAPAPAEVQTPDDAPVVAASASTDEQPVDQPQADMVRNADGLVTQLTVSSGVLTFAEPITDEQAECFRAAYAPTSDASSPASAAPPDDTPVPPALPPTNLAELIRSSVRKAIPA